jgi:hypothetical protein
LVNLPIEHPTGQAIIACGSYELQQLEASNSNRVGKIDVYGVSCSPLLSDDSSPIQINPMKSFECRDSGGVLDMKVANGNRLYSAMSANCLDVYSFGLDHDKSFLLTKLKTIGKEGEGLFLSLDCVSHDVVLSTQSGSILGFQIQEESTWSESFYIPAAHTLNAVPMPVWIVTLDPRSSTTIISGGDDCQLKVNR